MKIVRHETHEPIAPSGILTGEADGGATSQAALTPYERTVYEKDMRNIAYRLATAVPRLNAWANGQKISVRAGLFVSRAKSVAAFALALGVAAPEAIDVASQLTGSEPSRVDYRRFIAAVVRLLEALAAEAPSGEDSL
jgi:hypothetical protein